MHRFAFLTFLLLLSVCALNAQSASADQPSAASSDYTELSGSDLTLYADTEGRTYFIDFETLTVNLNDIVLRSADGQVVIREDVFELPVNTIYELDLSSLKAGQYQLELRSFHGMIRRDIELK